MTEHFIGQIFSPENIFLFFLLVVILYHNVMLCFWTSYDMISMSLIIINNALFIIDITSSQVDAPRFYFFP